MNSEMLVADALAEAGYARAISASEFKARLNRLNVEFPEAGNELISDILKRYARKYSLYFHLHSDLFTRYLDCVIFLTVFFLMDLLLFHLSFEQLSLFSKSFI